MVGLGVFLFVEFVMWLLFNIRDICIERVWGLVEYYVDDGGW